jgi:hypothetical protein
MSITAQEAVKLIYELNSSKDLTQINLPDTVDSYIRRSLRTTITPVYAQKKLLIFMVDFSKPTMIVTLPNEEGYKKTLFCIVRPGIDCSDTDLEIIIEVITTTCFQKGLYGHPLLIFLFKHSDEHRHTFQETFRDSYISTLNGMNDVLLAKDPNTKAQEILEDSDQSVESCPFSYLGPCQPNMFFGRNKIISEILHDAQKGYAITGGRRIGKTSLLIKLRYEIENNRYPKLNFKSIYIDCSTFSNYRELIAEITRKLSPKFYYHKGRNYSFTLLETLKRETSLRNKKLLLLLDEMDTLIIKAKEAPDKFFDSLRATLNEKIEDQ